MKELFDGKKVGCVCRCGFKKSYAIYEENEYIEPEYGTGIFPLDEDDKRLIAAWPWEKIEFLNGDSSAFPIGFVPKSWDDPKVIELFNAGFGQTMELWYPFRPNLSTPPAHIAMHRHNAAITVINGRPCTWREFITTRALYDGRERVRRQEGFFIKDFFDGPPEIKYY